jgi:hypothetical protein
VDDMRIRALTYEASPDSFKGSISKDQLLSRLWMSEELGKVARPRSAAVLGSWYGVLPYVLNKYNNIDRIYAIDVLDDCLNVSKKYNPDIKHIHADCNKLKYKTDCVINPSINNITGTKWYDNIPNGTLCLFQTEDIELGDGCPHDLESMKAKYPLNKYLYEGVLTSKDDDGDFNRSMVIGYK